MGSVSFAAEDDGLQIPREENCQRYGNRDYE